MPCRAAWAWELMAEHVGGGWSGRRKRNASGAAVGKRPDLNSSKWISSILAFGKMAVGAAIAEKLPLTCIFFFSFEGFVWR